MKKGFTLIELLAVIVILAIIALIATPMITNVINTAREGAAESSALGYVDAVEKQVMVNQVTDTKLFDLSESKVYTLTLLEGYGVTIKGEVESANVTIDASGAVTHACIVANDKTVLYDGSKADVVETCEDDIVSTEAIAAV